MRTTIFNVQENIENSTKKITKQRNKRTKKD